MSLWQSVLTNSQNHYDVMTLKVTNMPLFFIGTLFVFSSAS